MCMMHTSGPQRGGDGSDYEDSSHHRPRPPYHGDHSGNDDRLSRSCTPSDSRPSASSFTTSGEPYDEEQERQQEQERRRRRRNTARRTSKVVSKAGGSKQNGRNARRGNGARKSQVPLREVVACRAFECIIGAHGELSKLLDVDTESRNFPETGGKTGSEKSEHLQQHHHPRRHSHDQRPSSSYVRVESVPHGTDIDVDHQVMQVLYIYTMFPVCRAQESLKSTNVLQHISSCAASFRLDQVGNKHHTRPS